MTITAKIILDSINICENRLTTLELRYPRYIHAQIMTHRAFSRNVSSSRAIPTSKLIAAIREDMAIPSEWGENQRGMQAGEKIEGMRLIIANDAWRDACSYAIAQAEILSDLGVHKQHVNRLLEPFMHVTTLITATDFSNFFDLRVHEDAQPEIQALAIQIRNAMDASTPKLTAPMEWHLPYAEEWGLDWERRSMSVARCARVSYKLPDTEQKSNLDRDIDLHNKLLKSGHWSPFEHQAVAMATPVRVANFTGWVQYRQLHPQNVEFS